MKWQKHAFAAITLATRKKQSTLSMGTLRLLLSAVAFMALCFSFADMALAQTATAYSKEAMEQALATKHHYDLYGIHFDFDKAVIQPDSNALLDDITTALKNFPKWRLRITGHTDSTGDAAYNEELSMNRANAIKQALVERGIDAARLETLGMGEKQPVASNDTPEGQALNRRVELVRLDVKPNIMFIMADDIGWMQVGAYHSGLALGETPNIDRLAKEGATVHAVLSPMQSCTSGRYAFHHRHVSAPGRFDPAATPRQPDLPAARHARALPSSCWISATTPASSARTTWVTTLTPCRLRTGSRSFGAISTTSTPCSK